MDKDVAFPSQRKKGTRVLEASAFLRSCANGEVVHGYGEPARNGRDTTKAMGDGGRGGKGRPSEARVNQKPRAPRESISCHAKEGAVGTRFPCCLAPALPPVPARATAGHARARRAQSGCTVRAHCVAHHACLHAARSRALTHSRAQLRARE